MDYFNPIDSRTTFTMPDGNQKVFFRKLTQGDRVAINKRDNGVELNRETNSIKIDIDVETTKTTAIKRAIVGWELYKEDGTLYSFNKDLIERFVENLDPDIIDGMFNALAKENKWLNGGNKEDLQKQLESVQSQMKDAEDREKKL